MAGAGKTTTYGNHINGAWIPARSGKTFTSISPADRRVTLGEFAASSAEDVQDAVAAASAAAESWRTTSPIARSNILYKASEILISRANDVGRELTIEEGKTLKEGIGETNRAAQILRYFAGELHQPNGEHYASANPATMLYTVREPLGVVAIITPWNFPIAIPAWKIAPALAFGNPVVFKPASYTPLLAVRLVEALADAGLPPGVLNLVTGSASAIGDPLTQHPDVVAISFTGSGEVGRQLAVDAAQRGKKIQLELGGKNPAIVLADADMDHAMSNVIQGAMWSTGQKCTATSRAIVEHSIAEEFTSRLAERIQALSVGNPLDDGTQIGPVITEADVERLLGEVEQAEAAGAMLLAGGSRLSANDMDQGNFMTPTLFGNVGPDSRLGQDELFGPILGVITVSDMEEAMHVANSVSYGLSASLFTRDLNRALEFVKGIQAGVVHVNSETAGAEPHVPFGGYKGSSSYSREQGKTARDFYTQVKTVYLDMQPAAAG